MRSPFTPLAFALPVARRLVDHRAFNWFERQRRFQQLVIATGALAVVTVFAAEVLIRTVPSFGPALADRLRTWLGSENVTRLEELSANVEDGVRRNVSAGKSRDLSESTPAELVHLASADVPRVTNLSRAPTDVSPMAAGVAARGDGHWRAVPVRGSDGVVLYRTMLHPDAERSYTELFVFALDLSKVDVHPVAGTVEPKSADGAPEISRPGVVPLAVRDRLIAAFNGGFKAEHGHFGMMVDGRELLAAKPSSCTLAATRDGALAIGTWSSLRASASELVWWRQTPACMVEQGTLHPGLRYGENTNWGATLDGKTVIRRSAAGLSEDGKTLFFGLGNFTTARALATGMQHAGAVDVAQLDVNFSYPRFLLYQQDSATGELTALPAVKGLMYERDEYVGRPSNRDFFYVTRR